MHRQIGEERHAASERVINTREASDRRGGTPESNSQRVRGARALRTGGLRACKDKLMLDHKDNRERWVGDIK